jgi:redox-sensing transcriptional repressor
VKTTKIKVPEATVSRLSVYSRYLEQALEKGIVTVSSADIAKNVGVTPAQVRKDLAYFGEFGTRGVGYKVEELLKYIKKILGINTTWNVAIIGAGNLGTALCRYKGFQKRGFHIKGVFDKDANKIGQIMCNNIKVKHIENIPQEIKKNDITLAIIAVPASAAQEVVDILVKSGIKGIINFAPQTVNVPKGVFLRQVDLAAQLEVLTFNLNEEVLK